MNKTLANLINNGALPKDVSTVVDLVRIPNTNFLIGGLNMVYGLSGSGKSWQVASAFTEDCDSFYLDTDGTNGKAFASHCEAHDVGYIKEDTIRKVAGSSFIARCETLIELIAKAADPDKHTVIVLDSLTSIGEGTRINNAEDISPKLYSLNNLAAKLGICLVLIDHATRTDFGFKLEGNEEGKKRATVTTNRYEPSAPNKPEEGGVLTCERARGNADGLKVGVTQAFGTVHTLNDAIAFIQKKGNSSITQTEFSRLTKHSRDLWVREFRGELFDITSTNNKTTLTLKQTEKDK